MIGASNFQRYDIFRKADVEKMGTSYQKREVLISCYESEQVDMEGTQDYDLAFDDFRNKEDVENKPGH
jgi:ArsR family metal-binding transcriptional regulator